MSVNNKSKLTPPKKDPYKRIRIIHGEKVVLKKGTARSLTFLPQVNTNTNDMLDQISNMIKTLRSSYLDTPAERGARSQWLNSFDLIKNESVEKLTDLCAILEKLALMEYNVNRSRLRGQGPPNSVRLLNLDGVNLVDITPRINPELSNEVCNISVDLANDMTHDVIDVELFSPDPEPVKIQGPSTPEVPLVLSKTIIMPKLEQKIGRASCRERVSSPV